MSLNKYRSKRDFKVTEELIQRVAIRHPEAPGVAAALRFPVRMARRTALMGGSERPVAGSFGEAAGGAGGGSSGGVWRIRRHNSGGRIRRRHGDAVGSRDVDARSSRRGRGLEQG